jgi:hypothetical protein
MILSIISIASLTGSPIAGALIQLRNGDYLYAQIFGATSMAIGTIVLIADRLTVTGLKLRVKV